MLGTKIDGEVSETGRLLLHLASGARRLPPHLSRDRRKTSSHKLIGPLCSVCGGPRSVFVGGDDFGRVDLELPLDHFETQSRDGFTWIQALGTRLRAIQDSVTTVDPEGVLQLVESFTRRLVSTVIDPARGLDQGSWPEKPLGIPPIAWARSRAAGTEDALVKSIELRPIVMALPPFLLGSW